MRPNVVYGVARDQGISSGNTLGIQAAAHGVAYDIPFSGKYSWLYAGEAAAAFIAAVSQDRVGARIFDLNGRCETIEAGLDVLCRLDNNAQVSCSGAPFPFPPDLDETPVRKYLPTYPEVPVSTGIEATWRAFRQLKAEGRLPPLPE